jgi:hypothetical protein
VSGLKRVSNIPQALSWYRSVFNKLDVVDRASATFRCPAPIQKVNHLYLFRDIIQLLASQALLAWRIFAPPVSANTDESMLRRHFLEGLRNQLIAVHRENETDDDFADPGVSYSRVPVRYHKKQHHLCKSTSNDKSGRCWFCKKGQTPYYCLECCAWLHQNCHKGYGGNCYHDNRDVRDLFFDRQLEMPK